MRFLIVAGVLTLFAAPLLARTPAQAQTQAAECRTIQQSAERLACYDKIAPPVAATAQRGATKQADPTSGEDETLKSRLRDICQRC